MHSHDDTPQAPSRSRLKRAAEALQQLGEELLALSDAQLAQLPLPEKLREAVALARRIRQRSGLRRQRQYIGRLMRDLDPDPIRAALVRLRAADRISRARFQAAERWRSRLLAEGEAGLAEFLARYPAAERAQLHRLVQAASEEALSGSASGHGRALFRYLHALIGSSGRAEPRTR